MRCDVNVSVRRHLPEDGAGTALGERVEMKNLNSIRSVIGAIEYETSRQIEAIETSGDDRIISMETRSWDAAKGTTVRLAKGWSAAWTLMLTRGGGGGLLEPCRHA